MAGTGSVQVAKVAKVGDIQSTHQYDVTLKFDIAFNYGGRNNTGTANYNIACDGQNQSGYATFNIASGSGSWVWGNIASKTFRITMPTSGKSKTINFSAAINTGISPATISASGSYTLSAVTWQWSVSYNANGGNGAPESQTKSYNKDLTLSEDVPTRTGYIFKGWSTSNTASTATYASGGTYSANEGATLYAVWELETYTITYDANGGNGAPESQTKFYGSALTLSDVVPSRVNYNFKGWSTSNTASTATYASGGTYSANEGATLYAVWELAYWTPKVTNATLARCDGDRTLNEYGSCVNVKFDWECCQITGDNSVESITIKHAVHSTTEYVSTGIIASGVSGSVNAVIGDNLLSTDDTYDILIEIVDSKNGTSTVALQLSASAFTMDFLSGGKGVAIGKPSETEELFEIAWKTKLLKQLEVDGISTFNYPLYAKFGIDVTGNIRVSNGIDSDDTLTLTSPKIKMEATDSLTYSIPVVTNADCNTLTSSGRWYIGDGSTNRPNDKNGWMECKQYSTDYCAQIYTTYGGEIYKRYMRSGTWGIWTGGLRNMTLLWSGTLSKGGSVSVVDLELYDLFMARTSDGATMMIGTRTYNDNGNRADTIRFVGGYDDGTSSFIFKANTTASGQTFTLVQCSMHKLANSGITGRVLTLKSLWGIM